MSLPQITLQGNVCLEPNLQFTTNGTAMTRLRVACGERKKDDQGNWVDGETTFLDCTIWGYAAESAVEAITKGTPVIVIGKLKQRTYENKEGNKVTAYDVSVDSIAVDVKRSAKLDPSDPWGGGTSPF
jgi:single-strand DNA-binding protein